MGERKYTNNFPHKFPSREFCSLPDTMSSNKYGAKVRTTAYRSDTIKSSVEIFPNNVSGRFIF